MGLPGRPPGRPPRPRERLENKVLSRLSEIEDLAYFSPDLRDNDRQGLLNATRQVRMRINETDSQEEAAEWEKELGRRLQNEASISESEIDNDAARQLETMLSEYLRRFDSPPI